MNPRHSVSGLLYCALPALMIVAGCASSKSTQPKPVRIDSIRSTAAAEPGQLNQSQLQALVMSMADTYVAGMTQNAILLERQATTPEARYQAHAIKYLSSNAAFDIAVGPSPSAALLDLLVLSRLFPISIDRRIAHPRVVPLIKEHGQEFAETCRRLEAEIWKDAARVLTTEQLQELRELIDEWLEERPDVLFVHLVRLSDFTELRDVQAVEAAKGLLAEVGNATRAVDDMRLLAERGLWFSSRMPLLLGFQVEYTLYDIAAEPEVVQLVNDSLRFTDSWEQLVADIHGFPEVIDQQRAAFFRDVDAQREALLTELDSREGMLRGALSELRETISAANRLIISTESAVESVDGVVSRFDKGEQREPLDITTVRDVAIETAVAAERLTDLLDSTQGLLASPDWDNRILDLETAVGTVQRSGSHWISLTFRQGLYLIAAFFVGLFLYRLVSSKFIR